MIDGYTGETINANDIKKVRDGEEFNYITELDHVVAASEIHNDLGRILSGENGVELANSEDNLISTHWVINNAKNDHDFKTFLEKGGVRDQKVEKMEKDIAQKKSELSNSHLSQEERTKKEEELRVLERKKEILENLDEEKCLKIEKDARDKYNNKISWEYYAGSKFLKSTAIAAGNAGLKMGTRQALGLVLAEIWFELRERIPEIYQELKQNFTIVKFLEKIAQSLKNIFERVKERFKDLLSAFKDGAIAGVFGNISTTIMNIFLFLKKWLSNLFVKCGTALLVQLN